MYFSRLLVLHLRISMLDQYGHLPSTLFHALLACTMDHSINDYILEVEFEADIMTKAAEDLEKGRCRLLDKVAMRGRYSGYLICRSRRA